MPKKAKSKPKAKLNIKNSKKGRRAAPPQRRKVAVSIPALEAARRAVVYRWHPTEMNAPAEALRCQSLAKEIAAELRAKVRSESSMLAGQRVLITKFDHDQWELTKFPT